MYFLPTELVLCILSYLCPQTIFNLKQTSRYFNSTISTNILARLYIQKYFYNSDIFSIRLKYVNFISLFSEKDIIQALKYLIATGTDIHANDEKYYLQQHGLVDGMLSNFS